MTTQIPHFIDGRRSNLASTRTADVLNPSTGAVQAQVLLASAADVDTAVASAVEAQKEWAAWNPQRRARVMMKFVELVNANTDELAELLSHRARQDRGRFARRHPARYRGHRVRHRHPAPAQGRVHRGCGRRHRRLLDPPAARRGRRHHAVQLPGDDPAVEGRPGAGMLGTPSSSSRPSATPRYRCGWPNSSSRPACRPVSSRWCRATRRPSTPSCIIRTSRPSASSVAPISRSTSTAPRRPTASARSASAAPRTT